MKTLSWQAKGGAPTRPRPGRRCVRPARARALVGELVQGGRGFLRDHQGVTRAQGAHVEEGQHSLVLVHAVTGDLAPDDAGEDGLAHAFAPSAALARRARAMAA